MNPREGTLQATVKEDDCRARLTTRNIPGNDAARECARFRTRGAVRFSVTQRARYERMMHTRQGHDVSILCEAVV